MSTDQFDLFKTTDLLSQSPDSLNLRPTMSDPKKKNYNKQHYQKHKKEILNKAKMRYRSTKHDSTNVISLFGNEANQSNENPPTSKKPEKKRARYKWSTAFLRLLVAAFGYFLITETAQFYAQSDTTLIGPILKALLLEGAVLAFALMRPRSALSGLFQKLMVVVIYVYTVLVMSGSVFHSAFEQRAEASVTQKTIVELETEIEKLTQLRDSYNQANRITLATKKDGILKELKDQLAQLRAKTIHIPTAEEILNTVLALVVFRVLVMISHVYCLRELERRHRVASRTV